MARKRKPKAHAKTKKAKKAGGKRKWSGRVTARSDALDLKQGVFKGNDPKEIAASLKRSAEKSKRRKSSPYRSAMSMLTFYINRASKELSPKRKRILDQAKDALREQFGKKPA